MMIQMFRAKLHQVKVTGSELNYMGSITLDPNLIEAANFYVGERVQIVNTNNGERFETYVIKGERGSGECTLNGPAARKVQKGDVLIVIAYAFCTPEEAEKLEPTLVFPDENNRVSG